jgi:HK97 family phage prohead protease
MSKTIKEIKKKLSQKSEDEKIYKIVPISEFKVDAEKGIIEAYVSIFNNVDLGGDKILPGAFADSLKKKLPKGVWSHNWDQPIAKTLEAREDEKGLYVKGQFNMETQRGKEAFSDIKFGIMDEFSIGFGIQEYSWEMEGEEEIRVIKKIKLYEWSPVLAGMNPETELIAVKGDKKEAPSKIIFQKIDSKKKILKVYYADKTVKEFPIHYRYSKYIKSLDKKGAKVEAMTDVKKIIRIRQAAKIIDKGAEFLLRITK